MEKSVVGFVVGSGLAWPLAQGIFGASGGSIGLGVVGHTASGAPLMGTVASGGSGGALVVATLISLIAGVVGAAIANKM